ncbi:MAG TPA: NAD(P)/FAD-dependent oxidoreductase [Phycisphaerae bacterium]|nr:NAD(P)/FAD-dependent oxidoreductase [Phycisphaerae bacterium]
MPSDSKMVEVAVVGAGAAGLAAAIFAARARPGLSIVALDGAKKLGAKILVSGGGRCNVTNRTVTVGDFWGGSRHVVQRILNSLSVEETIAFFNEIGVHLHEEENGKLFPDSNSAKTVLSALIAEAQRRDVRLLTDHRVTGIRREEVCFELATTSGLIAARSVVLATGGLSLPKTGSDGGGYHLAESLGHALTPTTPGLAPLVLDGDFHPALSGISHVVELTIRIEGQKPVRMTGSMLWTHFGVSGPVALDASRHWLRARLELHRVAVSASFCPGDTFESLEQRFMDLATSNPKAQLRGVLSERLPNRVAKVVLQHLQIADQVAMAHLAREDRRRLVRSLLEWPLPVVDSRGYGVAEVTAGGVPLTEIDPATMESRKCPGLYLVGEILDVDGRIGGFNFQWAWSSGCVAGKALADAAGYS